MCYPTVKTGVYTQKLASANPNNERGKRTFELHFPGVVQCTTYFRLAGEDFGGHFHKGEDPSKRPEIFQLIAGVMEFRFVDKFGSERIDRLDATDGRPVLLNIEPYILHYAHAVSDVIYIELRPTPFDSSRSDCYPPEEF